MKKCPVCELPLPNAVAVCPSCRANLSGEEAVPVQHGAGGTLIERPAAPSPGGVAKTIVENRKPDPPPAQAAPVPPPVAARPIAPPDLAVPFRPLNSPPMLKICLLDPGSRDEGEWFRIRERRFVIGRAEGNLVLGHDEGLSGIHCELVRRTHGNGYRFVLVDLNSTNGTFVRVAKVTLRPGQELMIGGRRYAYDSGSPEKPGTPAPEVHEDDDTPAATISWQTRRNEPLKAAASGPALVEVTPGNSAGRRLSLTKGTHLIGSDPRSADLVIPDDPFVSGTHARINKTDAGAWRIENRNSLNGLWLRVAEMPLEQNAEFQISEQRFLVRPLPSA